MNCLKIGRKSAGVMVTGGEDKRVNLFAIGKPKPILSLTGHQSAVECVTFDRAEEAVVAGAAGGTLKLFDLDAQRAVRTLAGHRSNCVSVDFHPFGEFFASGSLDTNLKIWDVRRKGCIHTYKGHDRGVSACRFSPDGKWVLSGGLDGAVKLWDLTAGKMLRELPAHEGAVTCAEFHPCELLVATGGHDRSVKFVDLETFELCDEAAESTGVRSMLFATDGSALLTATSDFLKVRKWEPSRTCDAVDVSWSKLADLSVHEGKLLGASHANSFVGVWVVDLRRVEPFKSGKDRGPGGGGTREVGVPRAERDDQGDPEAHAEAVVSAAVAHAREAAKARVEASNAAAARARDALERDEEDRARNQKALEKAEKAARRGRAPRGTFAAADETNRAAIAEDRAFDRAREKRNKPALAMNAAFAAAHGIAEDPLAAALGLSDGEASDENAPDENDPRGPRGARRGSKKPSLPGDARAVAERRDDNTKAAGKIDGDPETLAAALRLRRNEEDLADVVEEENIPGEAGPGEGVPGTRSTSLSPSPSPPVLSPPASPPMQNSPGGSRRRRGRFLTPEKDGAASRASRALDLETLRSAALEAETTFVDVDEDRRRPADEDEETIPREDGAAAGGARGGGMEEGGGTAAVAKHLDGSLLGVETLASAMARAREDRAREPTGGSTPAARDDARVATPGVGAFRDTGADRAAEFPLDDERLRAAEFPLDDGVSLRGASPVTPGRRDPRAEPSPSSVAASPGAGPLGLDFADFVPGAANPRASPSPSRPVADESVVLARMEAPEGGVVAGILSARLASLRAAKARWTRNDPRGVAETLARAGDASAIVDVLAAILDGAARAKGLGGLASRAEPPLTLDVACCVTPLAASVVRSPHATYADAAIRFARLVATSFGEVVRDASGSPGSIGVDVEGEERARKAGAIRNALRSMVDALEEIGGGGGSSRRGRGNSEGSSRGCE